MEVLKFHVEDAVVEVLKMLSRINSQFLRASVTVFISVWALGGMAILNLSNDNGVTTVLDSPTLLVLTVHFTPSPLHLPPLPLPPLLLAGLNIVGQQKEREIKSQAALAKTAAPASAATSSSS